MIRVSNMKFAESNIGGVALPHPTHRQSVEAQLTADFLSFRHGPNQTDISPTFYEDFDNAASLYPMLNRIFIENTEFLRYKNISPLMANTLSTLIAQGHIPSPFTSFTELGKFLTNLPLHPEQYHTKITE